MKKNIIVVAGMFIVLVIAFFAYDLMKSFLSPCETIFEQTSVQLGSKLKVLQTQGEVFIGKNKIQDLTETAQVTALNLKTCCIVLNAGNVDSKQFLQCKDTAKEYEAKVDTVLADIEAAEEARKSGKTEILEKKIRALNSSVDEAARLSKELQNQIDTLSETAPEKKTDTKKNQIATQPLPVYTPAADSGIKLTTILSEGSEPLTRDLSYTVYTAKKDIEGKRQQVTYSYDAAPFFKLPVGRYYVQVGHGQAHANTEVEVTDGQVAELTLNINGGYLKLFTVVVKDAEPVTKDLSYSVYSADKDLEGRRRQITYSYDATPLFKLPSGSYYVQVGYGQASAGTEVEVTAGELIEQTLNLNAGLLRLSTTAAEDTTPITKDLSYSVYSADKDLAGRRQQITYSYDATPLFKLPAGRYYITVGYGQANASTEVEVTSGEITEQTLNLKAGYLKLSTTAAEKTEPITKDLSYSVYQARKDLDGKRKQITYSYDSTPLFKLPAGRYYITVDHQGANADTEVEIIEGRREAITLELNGP